MSNWITDRLPTGEDALDTHVLIWLNYEVHTWTYYTVAKGTPWQPIPRPTPYVKPKRWTVTWEQRGRFILWTLCSYDQSVHTLHGDLPTDAAERIADIYNEVMP
jgi:hypothetical protein